jgi:glutamate dehydrogenase/leucine dehydrogenase
VAAPTYQDVGMMESKSVSTFEELLESWDGETALIHRARESGAWIFVCLHSTRLGPAGGGTRMNVYDTPAEALLDAMRLSAAMTRKLAVAGLPFGGGKAVIAVPEIPSGEERRALLLRYGDLVASLIGAYRTSSDINTGETDMDASSRSSDSSSSAGANPSSTRALAQIGETLREIYARADARGISTAAAADVLAEEG